MSESRYASSETQPNNDGEDKQDLMKLVDAIHNNNMSNTIVPAGDVQIDLPRRSSVDETV